MPRPPDTARREEARRLHAEGLTFAEIGRALGGVSHQCAHQLATGRRYGSSGGWAVPRRKPGPRPRRLRDAVEAL